MQVTVKERKLFFQTIVWFRSQQLFTLMSLHDEAYLPRDLVPSGTTSVQSPPTPYTLTSVVILQNVKIIFTATI